jgi:branched-chain amino acid transport system substrate-binding protein
VYPDELHQVFDTEVCEGHDAIVTETEDRGLMAITESEHFFGTALAIEEINNAGGILGREVEVVAYDPGSNPETYRKLADPLLTEDGASVIFGCSTSAERKAVLPAMSGATAWSGTLRSTRGLSTRRTSFTPGPAPIKTVFLSPSTSFGSTDRAFISSAPTTSIRASPTGSCVIWSNPTPGRWRANNMPPLKRATPSWCASLDMIRIRAPDVVFSTIMGRTAQRFYRLYAEKGFDPARLPIASLTMAEGEVREIGPEYCVGHLTAASYFTSLQGERGRLQWAVIQSFTDHLRKRT